MRGAPLLSVIIPVFNREEKIADTIRSMVGPCAHPYELVVVDDGSTDGTVARTRAAIAGAGLDGAARVVIQRNAGPGAARNHGARLARGRYLAFLDSDDLWFPWTLESCAQAVLAHADGVLFFLQNRDFTPPERPAAAAPGAPVFERHARFLTAVRENPASIRFGSSNVLMRRDVFLDRGGFTERVRCSEDTDLFLRADPAGPCILVRGRMMMGYALGGGDSLTGDFPCVARGFDYMLEQERSGGYPGGRDADPARTWLLAGSAVHTVRLGFALGHPRAAYRLLVCHAALIRRGGRSRWLARLVLTPLLAQVRPRSYPFRPRPA